MISLKRFKMATLKDVAQRAGVSEATVSMVLNGKPGPKRTTRLLVERTASELRYVPNTHARNLARGETSTIGFIVTDIENPFFGSLTRYVNHFLEQRGRTMILSLSGDDSAKEDAALKTLLHQGVGGIILSPTQLSTRDTTVLEGIVERGVPIVFVSSYYANFEAPRIPTDYRQGSRDLVRYLIDSGHADVRFLVSADLDAPIASERIAGFVDAYRESGLSLHESAIHQCPHPDYESGYRETEALLKVERPDAIIAINDVMALAAKRAARNAGLTVPRDISIAGYDDVVFASIAETPLTTVRQNIAELARCAVDMVFPKAFTRRIDTRIPPELVVRASTGGKRLSLRTCDTPHRHTH